MLKAMELGIIGIVALAFAVRPVLHHARFRPAGSRCGAQLVMKNRVLITAVLILSYGIYVPLSWHHAAMVVGPLAALAVRDLADPLFASSQDDGLARAHGDAGGPPRLCFLVLT